MAGWAHINWSEPMNGARHLFFGFRTRLSHESIRLAMLLAPSDFTRIWLNRGLAIASEGMREEIRTGAAIDKIELEFPAHSEAIPSEAENDPSAQAELSPKEQLKAIFESKYTPHPHRTGGDGFWIVPAILVSLALMVGVAKLVF